MDPDADVVDAEIVEPVRVEAGAVVRGGRIGPNVTVERDAHLVDAVVRDTLVGTGARLEGVELRDSLVNDRARVTGFRGRISVAADSSVEGG